MKNMKPALLIVLLLLFLVGCASSVDVEQDTTDMVDDDSESMDSMDDTVDDEGDMADTSAPMPAVDESDVDEMVVEDEMMDDSMDADEEETAPVEGQTTYLYGDEIDVAVQDVRIIRTAGDGMDTFTVEFLVENVGSEIAEIDWLVLRHATLKNISRFRYEGPWEYTLGVGEERWIASPIPGEIASDLDFEVEVRGRVDTLRDSEESNDRFNDVVLVAPSTA